MFGITVSNWLKFCQTMLVITVKMFFSGRLKDEDISSTSGSDTEEEDNILLKDCARKKVISHFQNNLLFIFIQVNNI